jgi:CMP-N,N'-diacetyllegionaminic acid synthase
MKKTDKAIAIILARGGSKGIYKKNLSMLLGKPLIAWSISTALSSNSIDKVYLSSDDDEILDTARLYGAEVIKRPFELSNDQASSESGWLHVLDNIPTSKNNANFFALQATSPYRLASDFDNAYIKFNENNYDSLFSAEGINDHFIWADDSINMVPDNFDYNNRAPRQNLKLKYLENGSFYIINSEGFRENKKRHFGKIGVYQMPKSRSFQIDTKDDLDIARAIMKEFIDET